MTRGRPPYDDILTPAEWRVAQAVRHGRTNPEIARRLGVSVDAVKYHVANILQKLGFSSRAELRQWGGVQRTSALSGKAQSMDNPNASLTVGQIARTVNNIAEASRWYADVLGLDHLYTFGNLAFFSAGNLRLFLSEGDGEAAESIIYFKVDDIHRAQAKLEERGATFTNAPHMVHRHDDGTEEWMAFLADNEGRPLGLMALARPREEEEE
jgi:DNA-binding CsgD family transcriptional regulator/predicted enzyme related to lactoylglutathione lyase